MQKLSVVAFFAVLLNFCCFTDEISGTVIYNNRYPGYPSTQFGYPSAIGGIGGGAGSFGEGHRRQCPLCDSSVYSYCSDKLFHDSCCCYRPANPYDRLPYECQYADCSFLHANSCKEHELISACCCTNLYVHKKK